MVFFFRQEAAPSSSTNSFHKQFLVISPVPSAPLSSSVLISLIFLFIHTLSDHTKEVKAHEKEEGNTILDRKQPCCSVVISV